MGEHGIVIGWSFDRSKNNGTSQQQGQNDGHDPLKDGNSIPTVLRAPIVSNEICFKSNADFRNLSSNRTFCAGLLANSRTLHLPNQHGHRRSNPSIYTGISGAGLMILKNNRWMLRGTVSAALPAGQAEADEEEDNPFQYIIYADVAKFIDWIMAFII